MIETLLDRWRNMGLPAWAEHKYGWICEDGKPITLTDWQRAILGEYWQRRADVSTLLISTTKKAGKTLLNSLVTCYRWLTVEYPAVHFTIGNDRDQSAELQITMIGEMVKRHPVLSRFVKVTRNELTFEPTGARLVALAMDWAGSGGGNFSTVSFSELWAFTYECGRRLYEELTPIPHLDPPCLRIVDSYAGFELESELLADVWKRGESGERVNDEWPIYLQGQQLSYIHQGQDAQVRCWRGDPAQHKAYYQEQRETLRANTYRRLHLNEWVSSESVFILPELWEACVDPDLRPLTAGGDEWVAVGLDLAIRPGGDDAVAIGLYGAGDKIATAFVKVWKGSERREDLRISEVVEPALLQIAQRCNLLAIALDPWQGYDLAQRLEARGLPVITVPQSHRARGASDTLLWQMARAGDLRLLDVPELRNAAVGAAAKELPDGKLFITKGSARSRVDILVAMSIGLHGLANPVIRQELVDLHIPISYY
jgi:phage terminase large subunit-like protein